MSSAGDIASLPCSVFRGLAIAALLTIGSGCATLPSSRPSGGRQVVMTVTAYCPCGACCGWTRNWLGLPVHAGGPRQGKPKAVGVCADGTRAKKGIIAADTRHHAFGTRMYVPGYGYGVVHDTGADITGPDRIDIYFSRHSQALQWGRRRLPVTVYP